MTATTTTPAATTTRRGTSNSNSRGSSKDRAARRAFLINTFGDGVTAPCYFCGGPLQNVDPKADDYITVDRIIPGAHGGRYTRDNIRPAHGKCNSEDGGKISHGLRLDTHTTTITL